jgi:hypothetical protein
MLRCGLSLGAIFCKLNFIVKAFLFISLHVIYFLHLWSTLCTHTYYISYILLLYSVAQKMKSSLMKTSSKRAGPWSSSYGMVPYSAV